MGLQAQAGAGSDCAPAPVSSVSLRGQLKTGLPEASVILAHSLRIADFTESGIGT
jgi:hypothetical protein